MKRTLFFLIAMLVSVLVVGCGTDNNAATSGSNGVDELIGKNVSAEKDMTMELVASEKNLPSNFDGLAFERKEAPYFQYLVKRAENQSEYEAAWDLFELEEQAPDIDFDANDAFFFGYYESGHESANCPIIIENIKMGADHKEMTVSLFETTPYDGCDDVATPRASVVKTNKDISKAIETIRLDEGGAETVIPLDK